MLPRYDELPEVEGTDLRCAWGVFGPDAQLGTLNLLTAERRREAAALVRSGEVVNLSLPLDRPSAPAFGRRPLQHDVYALSRSAWDDRVTLDLQASSQWDGFLHVRHRAGSYGGHTDDPRPGGRLGIDRWVTHGVVGRGVLLDVPRWAAQRGETYDARSATPLPAALLARVADDQGVEVREGDVLLVRTGWDPAAGSAPDEPLHCAGLAADTGTARWLWDSGVAAVACDNPTVEVQPGDPQVGFLHWRLLTMLGMPLGELFDLAPLADRCAAAGVWEFLFVAAPLNLPGAVGSPANALAVL